MASSMRVRCAGRRQPAARCAAGPGRAGPRAAAAGAVGVRRREVARRAVYDNYEPVPDGPESWPVPEFMAKTVEAFPEKAIANHEETRVLLDHGYTWLDVRSKAEAEEERIVGSVNIPLINATKKFDSEVGDRVLKQGKKNPDFMSQVEKKFKNKEALILVGCSDGRNRAIQALQVRARARRRRARSRAPGGTPGNSAAVRARRSRTAPPTAARLSRLGPLTARSRFADAR